MNAKHSSASALWYTPLEIIRMARLVLGGIDFDPASDAEANKTVRATAFAERDGLAWARWPWHARIWLNPPGGKDEFGSSNQRSFWDALTSYRAAGRLRHALFMAFSIESLQTTQRCEFPIMSFPICVPHSRIRFVSPFGEKNSPTHANAIVYVPGTEDATERFIEVFRELGACKR